MRAVALAALAAFPATASDWAVERAEIQFTARLTGGAEVELVQATLGLLGAEIRFDPDAPEAAVVDAVFDMRSAATGEASFDRDMAGATWLDTGAHADARFVVEGFLVDEAGYEATGTLTLLGISQPVDLAFAFEIDGDWAEIDGQAEVDRFAFGIGADVPEDLVAAEVPVAFSLTVSRQPGGGVE